MQAEMNHNDVEPLAKLIDAKNWSKTMEGIKEYLCGCFRVMKIPVGENALPWTEHVRIHVSA